MVGSADGQDAAPLIASLVSSGAAADLVLVCLLLEGIVLWQLAGRTRAPQGRVRAGILANLASGAGLVLALRAALLQQGWGAIAACLGFAFLAHASELALRWRSLAGPSASHRS